ncbi:MAG: polysaccharide pyruvyl transferase family protein [Desulfobulbaceae bacterium]|jgi:polysaccharide pyruvyl transferase WcaK-like protein|nr:polysaccharide pyruvyl transferase family protein [Desulfobulbaceae bacterium]
MNSIGACIKSWRRRAFHCGRRGGVAKKLPLPGSAGTIYDFSHLISALVRRRWIDPPHPVGNFFRGLFAMLNTVCLLGSASGRNAGDAALMSGIMEAIDQRLGRQLLYRIPTLSPAFVRQTYQHNRVEAVSVLPWTGSVKLMGLPAYKAVTSSDLSLVFDAVLFDRSLYNPMFNFLSSLAWLLPKAKQAGRRVGLYNCGIGPIKTKAGAEMLAKVCDACDFITVREQGSADLLQDLGLAHGKVAVTADAALNAPMADNDEISAIYRRIGFRPNGNILAININKYLDTWADQRGEKIDARAFIELVAQGIIQSGIEAPTLLVSTYHGDEALTRTLLKRLWALRPNKPAEMISNREIDHFQVKGVLSKVGLLFGMRLHAMILASSALTPIAGIAYQPKVRHYYEQLGIADACISFRDLTAAHLADFLHENWRKREETRAVLSQRIANLQRLAMTAADRVADLDC